MPFRILLLLGFALFAMAQTPVPSFDPRLSPRYVELLKRQAEARKLFYEDQAKEKAELKDRHATERHDLILRHRAARAEFGGAPHAQDERRLFFRSQRDEMADLKTRQKKEIQELDLELKRKLQEFHESQEKASQDLQTALIKEQGK